MLTNAAIYFLGLLGTNFVEINQNKTIWMHKNEFQNVIWKMAVIFSWPQWVKKKATKGKKGDKEKSRLIMNIFVGKNTFVSWPYLTQICILWETIVISIHAYVVTLRLCLGLYRDTVRPRKYAPSPFYGVGTDGFLPISFRVTSLALEQSCEWCSGMHRDTVCHMKNAHVHSLL